MRELTVWFWQRMVTPHMAYLASSLAKRGHAVSYFAEQTMSPERASLGWKAPSLDNVNVRVAASPQDAKSLVASAPSRTIHLTQGLRANGNVAAAQKEIAARQDRHFALIEQVDQRGLKGVVKRPLYAWHLHRWTKNLDGILAIGVDTSAWLKRLGPHELPVLPFAYFLPNHAEQRHQKHSQSFRILFVGALIRRKNVELIFQALSGFAHHDFELVIIGDGPLRTELEALAGKIIPGRYTFLGVQPIQDIHLHMAGADCLILPSWHDGWGAVVSEALLAGTPVICSSACGSSVVVQASGFGGVFKSGNKTDLCRVLDEALETGMVQEDQRRCLRSWAQCLSADAGAEYLEEILKDEKRLSNAPPPPWEYPETLAS